MLNKPRNWFLFFWIASAVALTAAFISQFVFKLQPCHLCLYQRLPYSFVLLLLTPLLFYKKIPMERIPVIMAILALAFFVEAGLAGYHTGVEQKWWAGPTDCSGNSTANTLEAMRAEIMGAVVVRCDEPAFVFLKLSMAAWNVFYSWGLFAVALLGIKKWQKPN